MITATTIPGLHLTKGVGIEITSIWSSLFLNMKKKKGWGGEIKFWRRRKNIIEEEGNVIMEMEEENIIVKEVN